MRPSPPGTVFRPSASNQPGMSSAYIEFRIAVCGTPASASIRSVAPCERACRKIGIGPCRDEREVDDLRDTGGRRGVDEVAVVGHALLGALVQRDHEHAVALVEGGAQRRGVGVVGGDDLGAGDRGRPGRVAHEQPLLVAAGGQLVGHQAAHMAGRSGDDEHALRVSSAGPSRRHLDRDLEQLGAVLAEDRGVVARARRVQRLHEPVDPRRHHEHVAGRPGPGIPERVRRAAAGEHDRAGARLDGLLCRGGSRACPRARTRPRRRSGGRAGRRSAGRGR